eukprot:Gb_03110 [translate_table: standard]
MKGQDTEANLNFGRSYLQNPYPSAHVPCNTQRDSIIDSSISQQIQRRCLQYIHSVHQQLRLHCSITMRRLIESRNHSNT